MMCRFIAVFCIWILSLASASAQNVVPFVNGAAVSTANPLPVVTEQYLPTATAITGNGTGTTGSVVGTLAAVTGKTTYICGFNVSAIGGTAAVGPIVIANLVGSSSMTYELASSVAGNSVTQTFTPCIPATAVDTTITVTTTADGTASAVAVNSWGFQQ